MFGLDPFSRPVAITEALLILSLAAFVGWLLGRLILNGRISALQADIADKEVALDECRRAKATPSVNTQRVAAPVTVPVVATPVVDVPRVDVPVVAAAPVMATPVVEVPTAPVSPAEMPVMASIAAIAAPVMEKIAPVAAPAPVSVPATGGSEDAVLNRIASRASEINFDRIGRASAAEADDLKDIVGVGPFLERKLHSLGIYTFRQVANFTKEDIAKVNEIIEFFPGRIQRDNWVDQSKNFYENKYGKKHDA